MAEKSSDKVRALIVEDEEFGRRVLRSLLASDRDVAIIDEARSAPEARLKIAELQPDLVFMDIGIPEGNGIELLQSLDAPPYAILVTAHSEFAVPAFELPVIDYLVKPVDRRRFARSVARAKQRIGERRIADLAWQIAGAVAAKSGATPPGSDPSFPGYPNHLVICVRRRKFMLDLDEIFWIQGAGQYSRVHAKGGDYLLSRTLGSIECELDPERFFRVHRSAIVNAAFISEVRSCGDGRYNIYLRGGQALPLGRARRAILSKLPDVVSGRRN